jgi:hypothetical protein
MYDSRARPGTLPARRPSVLQRLKHAAPDCTALAALHLEVRFTEPTCSTHWALRSVPRLDVSPPPTAPCGQRRPDPASTITLAPGATPNTVYVFIYELDSTGGNPSPRWSCATGACTATNGSAVRTSGHERVVVDLKIKWQPVLARFLGIPTVLTFDAQSVDRMEF